MKIQRLCLFYDLFIYFSYQTKTIIAFIHGGELRDLNESVHGILCLYSDKISKINLS